MSRSLLVEGDIPDDDVAVQLTTQGSVTTPSRQVPRNVSKITTIMASGAPDFAAAGAGCFLVRLSGTGIQGGEQVVVIGSAGGQAAQSGADAAGAAPYMFEIPNADIAVSQGDVIDIQAEFVGDDLGDHHIQVCLLFDN